MRRATLAAAVAALLVVASVAAVLAGVVPLGGVVPGADAQPTATAGGPGGGTATPGGTATAGDGATPAATFRIEIREIVECGTTCRDVTLALANVGDAPATGVTVETDLFAGNSTDGSDRIWEDSEDVGRLAAGESYTTTERVTLSMSEGLAVQQADGWVTVRTTIRTDDGTVTFTERRDVL